MTVSLADLQAYLRRVAAQQYDTLSLPGLTLYFHPRDDLTFFNYAIPDAGLFGAGRAADLDVSLAQMRAEFSARGRRPRFEFIHEIVPELGAVLRAAGFVEEARQSLMVCEAQGACAPPPVPGLRIDELDDAAPVDEMQTFLTVQRRGFDPKEIGTATEDEARHFVRTLGQGRAFVARVDERAIAAGMYSDPLAVGPRKTRITELVGLATLAPFRRRGIATALTARALHSAFDLGVDVVCLVAADERAGRVYERVGFRARATMLAYVEGQERREL